MKNLIKTKALIFKRASILLVVLTAFNCGKKDEVTVEPETAFGKWELTGNGHFRSEYEKYVHINSDNTITVLSEDSLSFKSDWFGIVTVSDDQITTSVSGGEGSSSRIYNYTLEEDTLTLERANGATIELKRNNNIPEVSDWFEELTILSEGPAPWAGDSIDIAYNGTHIVYGTNRSTSETIGLVNTDNFNLDGEITTTHSAYAVEVEKGNASDRYIFQSHNGFDEFYAYTENTNTFVFKSPEFGAWIYGLASVDDENIWASSGNERRLYHYNYSTQEIVQTIDLDFSPKGLDYQGGFLYVSDGTRIHKCQTSPTFKPVESYGIKNHRIYGIAYDGTNFWLSTRVNGSYKLIKTDLTP